MMDTLQSDIVYALSLSPTFVQDGIAFAARHSGLYRSVDGGTSWILTYDSLKLTSPLPTTAVTLSPNFLSDRTVFAGVHGGVLRSFDGGQTWGIASLSLPPPIISTLIVSPDFANDSMVFAGSMDDGFFCSTDQGHHWRTWNFGLLDLNIICLAVDQDFSHTETIFAGTGSGLFRSRNGGRSWREIDFLSEFAPVLSVALSPTYAHDRTIFVGTESHGLICSQDAGNSWYRLSEDRIRDSVNGITVRQSFPEQPFIAVALPNEAILSRDGGQSWSSCLRFDENDQITCLGIADLDERTPLLVGTVNSGVLQCANRYN